MKALERNKMWVLNNAWDIGARKRGLAQYCFSVGEVKEALGFSHNTVKKHLQTLMDEGVIRDVVLTKSITIFKFTKKHIAEREEYQDQITAIATYGEGS